MHTKSVLAAALLVATPLAMAQSIGDVTIGGTLVPDSCTIDLSNGGVANFGTIDYATIPGGSASNPLPGQLVSINLSCSGPVLMALTATDNRSGTENVPGPFNYGLGALSNSNLFGRYTIDMSNPTLNGAASTMIASADLVTWIAATGGWHKTNTAGSSRFRSFGTAGTGPQPVTTASVNVTVNPALNGRSFLQLTQTESFDGNTTIEIVYL
jgi:type 1 fimbria pilin